MVFLLAGADDDGCLSRISSHMQGAYRLTALIVVTI